MLQSTCILDTTDDDDKKKHEERGKENIPPSADSQEMGTSLDVYTPRREDNDIMTEDVYDRSPLGELNVVPEYYDEGSDSFYDVVYNDEISETANNAAAATPVSQSAYQPGNQRSIISPCLFIMTMI